MTIARRLLQTNLQISDGPAMTSPVQVPNGATRFTIQFNYADLDDFVDMTLLQSIDGLNYDTCFNDNDEPVTITLDPNFDSMTLNITDLLAAWIKFSLYVGDASTGSIDKLFILMQ